MTIKDFAQGFNKERMTLASRCTVVTRVGSMKASVVEDTGAVGSGSYYESG